jgi:hypothetical protein
MKWGDWELIVSQHPPILRNTCWPKDIEIEDNIDTVLGQIINARSSELAGLSADTLGLIDAFTAIIEYSSTLKGEATFPLAAYSYAASLQPSAPEVKPAIVENEPVIVENEREAFERRHPQWSSSIDVVWSDSIALGSDQPQKRASSTRHPDQSKGKRDNDWPWS